MGDDRECFYHENPERLWSGSHVIRPPEIPWEPLSFRNPEVRRFVQRTALYEVSYSAGNGLLTRRAELYRQWAARTSDPTLATEQRWVAERLEAAAKPA